MVLSAEPPQNRSVMSSPVSTESVRSGYVLAGGRDPVEPWYVRYWSEILLCGCLCGSRNLDTLTVSEVDLLSEFRILLEEPWRGPDHEVLLFSIWRNVFPSEALPSLVDVKWTRLGFQSHNPVSDIRAGVCPIISMEYMSRVYPADFKRCVSESSDPKSEYPFAASCMSVSFSQIVFFKLNSQTSVNPSGCPSGTNRAIKQLVKLVTAHGRLAFDEIFSKVTLRIHAEWMNQLTVTHKSTFDIHYFATALSRGLDAMADLFNNQKIRTLNDLNKI